MNRPGRRIAATLIVVIGAMGLTGCPKSVRKQLESAAKDWSAMVRASQIIPVYPLTEDVQPGDIFLVQIPIDRQQEIFRANGYLPLDNHLARIYPDGYDGFYKQSFELKNGTTLHDLLDRGGDRKKAWSTAPSAAFPTYSFAVKRDHGLNLAIPLQGVPVGLSLLRSQEAVGSVSIRNARTLGVDILSLHAQLLRDWWPAHRAELSGYAPVPSDRGTRHNYLRVITRVYVTGEVDISLRDMTTVGGGLDVADPKPVDLLMTSPTAKGAAGISIDDYKKNVDTLNDSLKSAAGGLPGGSVRVTSASSRSIGLKETLVPPLTIGYLGFDVEILAGGNLGPAIPTHALLSKLVEAGGAPANVLTGAEAKYADAADAAGVLPDRGKAVFRTASDRLGPDWRRLYDRCLGSGDDYADAFGDLAIFYWTSSDRSVDPMRQSMVAQALAEAVRDAAPSP